jgi:snurportin-1
VKRHDNMTGQKKRRHERLLRQKSQREDAAIRARQLVEGNAPVDERSAPTHERDASDCDHAATAEVTMAGGAPSPSVETDSTDGASGSMGLERRRRRRSRRRTQVDLYATELTVPEWMIGVPDDLASQWYVVPRPQGKRCLVVANAGSVTARIRNGTRLEKFRSRIPGGGRSAGEGSGHYTILDCILHKGPAGSHRRAWTYYVVDCMCWNGHAVYDCTTEFRLFWLQSKLSEVGADVVSHDNERRILPLPCFPATPEGIATAYAEQFGFVKDCLLFLNQESHYQAGVSPLALLWKDPHCSAYFIESRSAGDEQLASLVLGAAGEFNTSDDPPMNLGTPSSKELQHHNLQPGDSVRCAITGLVVGSDPEDGGAQIVTGAAVELRGYGGQARAGADNWSKIIFQYQARTDPLQVGELVTEAARSTAAESGVDSAAATEAARALVARLVRIAELAGGAEAAAAASVAAAAASAMASEGPTQMTVAGATNEDPHGGRRMVEMAMDPCAYIDEGREGSEGSDELRIDPADGQAYNFASFVDVYGSFAEQHWSAAPTSRGSSSSTVGHVLQDYETFMDEVR